MQYICLVGFGGESAMNNFYKNCLEGTAHKCTAGTFRKKRSRGRAMVGTWLAGQRPGPAEPVAGTARLCDIRVEGRSVSGLRPDSLHPVPCIGWVAHTDAQCACCWGSWLVLAGSTARVAHLGRQHTSMPSGSGMLPGPALRAHRARRDHRALGLVAPFPVGLACPWLAVAPRSTAGSRP